MKRFRFTWSHLVAAIGLILIGMLASRCADADPLPPGIEGSWRQTAPASPGWVYTFDNGLVTQRVDAFGATLSALTFTYAERGDTVYIGGDASNPPRLWLVKMLGPSDMKVREQPQDTAARLWTLMYFERL